MPLIPGQFELDGYAFGCETDVRVRTFDPGLAATRTQDSDNPTGDGSFMGRDSKSGPTWTFEMATDARGKAAIPVLRETAAAWDAGRVRSTAGALSVMRYCIDGPTMRVYGRPRNYSVNPAAMFVPTLRTPILTTFDLADPLAYADEPASLDLGLVTDPGVGVVLPVMLPVVLGVASGTRQGVVDVDGDAPTPFTVTIFGPSTGSISGITITGPGWAIDLASSIAYDQSAVIDTRTMTVLRSDGVSLAGGLSARSRLSARLSPGGSEIAFSCTDPTNTARAVVSWAPAYYSL